MLKADHAYLALMKLGDWLRRNQVTRADFARRISLSPGAVTLICREHGSWLSRETAERIVAETLGAVTPNDFLNSAPPAPNGADMLNPVADAIPVKSLPADFFPMPKADLNSTAWFPGQESSRGLLSPKLRGFRCTRLAGRRRSLLMKGRQPK